MPELNRMLPFQLYCYLHQKMMKYVFDFFSWYLFILLHEWMFDSFIFSVDGEVKEVLKNCMVLVFVLSNW